MLVGVGDLLIPKTEESRRTWGHGVVVEPMRLDYPPAHLVFWLTYKRQIIIEQEVLEAGFDVIRADAAGSADPQGERDAD